jgi:hypothetical protein
LRIKRFKTIPYFSIDIPEAFRLQSLASSSGNAKGGKNRFLIFICSRCTVVEPTHEKNKNTPAAQKNEFLWLPALYTFGG